MKQYTLTFGGVFYFTALAFSLLAAAIINGFLPSIIAADAATGTSKIVVTRVTEPNTLFSGTKANVDAGISATGAQSVNPATFSRLAAGQHTVTVSKAHSSLTLKSMKMCTQVDSTTSCTANISVPFTCSATECTSSKITAGTRPVRVQAQYGRVY